MAGIRLTLICNSLDYINTVLVYMNIAVSIYCRKGFIVL